MSAFTTYLELGFYHILDPKGLDHLLFIVALCAAYDIKNWKRILILVTAFTVGHSLTLALSATDFLHVDSDIVEKIIAITIGVTALQNILISKPDQTAHRLKYAAALVFGLFHGLGFSGYFSSLLGREESILLPLFSFNLGIEFGQLIIVGLMLLFFLLADKSLKIKARDWNLFLSGLAFGASLMMLSDRL
ncbi:MAG: HupE/UreJ family protein [Bacteroidota bacterium]|nr:HupE/UreJ family protein [Bacteroidota bacterium]MDX5429862.1 HupE/UreJ family protein [Bacteroidota bacterium]MDX5468641.1 HupE/UreJ family protein [Bacteroidota bacterium]